MLDEAARRRPRHHPAAVALPAGDGRARRRCPRHRREAGDGHLRRPAHADKAREAKAAGSWSRITTTSSTREIQKILALIDSGEFGAVTHVEVLHLPRHPRPGQPVRRPERPPPLPVDGRRRDRRLPDAPGLAGPRVRRRRTARCGPSGRSDGNATRSPATSSGPWSTASAGPPRSASAPTPSPTPSGSASTARRCAPSANLFETRSDDRPGPRPARSRCIPLLNGLVEAAKDVPPGGRSAGSGASSAAAPGAYEGLWELLGRTYRAIERGASRRSRPGRSIEVNRLVGGPERTAGVRALKVLVTGANGFLGRHVVAEFLRRGHVGPRPGPPGGEGRPGAAGLARRRGGRSGPTSAPAATWPRRSTGSTCWSTWRPPSPAARTRSSPPRSSAPSGSWRRWPVADDGAWSSPAASRSTTGARSGAR